MPWAQQAWGPEEEARRPIGTGDYSGEIDTLLCVMKEAICMGSAELITVTRARPCWSGAERGGGDRPSSPSALRSRCTLGSSLAFEKYKSVDAMCFTQVPAGTDGGFQK